MTKPGSDPAKKDTEAASRKDQHLDLAQSDLAASLPGRAHPLDAVALPYHALPELALDQIDISTRFCGYRLDQPLIIGAMTGGTKRADAINAALAETAESCKVALAIGSQRASLAQGQSQSDLRKRAPSVPLIGNLGAVQLARPGGLDLARRAAGDLGADMLAIHLNPLQEAAQPEGETDWRGVLNAIETAAKSLDCPLLVKEVGAGLGPHTARQLANAGIKWLDVAGLGGTSWTRIEAARQTPAAQQLLAPFLDFGLTTPQAISQVRASCPDIHIIGSGGLRHGLDIARCLWLGAEMTALAGPLIKQLEGADRKPGQLDQDGLVQLIGQLGDQTRLALFLTASAHIADFRKKSVASGLIQ